LFQDGEDGCYNNDDANDGADDGVDVINVAKSFAAVYSLLVTLFILSFSSQ
jgi:hypothetical protein